MEKIAVIGAGLMGHGIAQVFAVNGHEVAIHDPFPEVLARVPERVRANLYSLGLDESSVERISLQGTLKAAVEKADIVFEAAPEVLAVLPGMTADRLDAILVQRQSPGDGQALLKLLGPAQSYATTEGSNASRVNVRITYDNGRRSHSEVIILPFDQGTEPYSVLAWDDELQPLSHDELGLASR